MIDPAHHLPVTKQAAVLRISRSGVYYLPRLVNERDRSLMNRIDRLHLDYSFTGARMFREQLGQEGLQVGRKHLATLMQKMGI